MPWESLQEFEESVTFRKSDTLKTMSAAQLQRFLDVFNAVSQRILDRGGNREQAESTAFAIAFSTARRVSASLGREMEGEVHFFAAMAPEQFGGQDGVISGQKLDYSWILQEPDLASFAVAGNEFNWDHDKTHTALGKILGIILPKEAPVGVREKVHRDIPFLFVASYYADVDPEVKKIETISAEWATLKEENGIGVPLPLSFAITRTPLNDPTLGIHRVASWRAEEAELKTFLSSITHETLITATPPFKEPRGTMPKGSDADDAKNLQEQVASLEEKLKGAQAQLASLQPIQEVFASLGKKPEDDPAMFAKNVAASLKHLSEEKASLEGKVTSLSEVVAGLTKQNALRDGREWAASLLKDGKLKADAVETWAASYATNPDLAKKLAEGLVASALGEQAGKGKGTTGDENAGIKEILAAIDPRMATKGAS